MPDLDFVTVVGRFGITAADTADLDDDPNIIWCDAGDITLEPLIAEAKVVGGSPVPWTGGQASYVPTIDAAGFLTWRGQHLIKVIDLTSTTVNPRVISGKATHKVTFRNVKSGNLAVTFTTRDVRLAADTAEALSPAAAAAYDLPEGTLVCDLTKLLPVPVANSVPIVVGQTGKGITSLDIDGTELVYELTDGTVGNAGELPVGPGGSDVGVAGYLDDEGSDTRAVLDPLVTAKVQEGVAVEIAPVVTTLAGKASTSALTTEASNRAAGDAATLAAIPAAASAAAASAVAGDGGVAAAAAAVAVGNVGLVKKADQGAPLTRATLVSYATVWMSRHRILMALESATGRLRLFAGAAFGTSKADFNGVQVYGNADPTRLFGVRAAPATGRKFGTLLESQLDGQGNVPQAILDRWKSRMNITATTPYDPASKYIPETTGTTPNRALYVNNQTTGKRVLITATNDPSSAVVTNDGLVTFTTSAGVRYSDATTGGDLGPLTSTYTIDAWGDSITENVASGPGPTYYTASPKWTERVATALGATVNNMGIGGLGPSDIATRQGGLKPAVTITGNQIPASGPVAGTLDDTTGWKTSGGSYVITVTGTLAGIPGTFVHDSANGNAITFTRTTAGSATACPAGTRFYATQYDTRRDNIAIIMSGRNVMNVGAITAAVAAMVGHLRPKSKRFIVMGPLGAVAETNPSAGYTTLKAIHAALAAAYGDRYYDLHSDFVAGSLAALTAGGVAPTSGDIAAVAAGAIPPSIAGDGTHPTQIGYDLIGTLVTAKLRAMGWFA